MHINLIVASRIHVQYAPLQRKPKVWFTDARYLWKNYIKAYFSSKVIPFSNLELTRQYLT